MQLKMNIYYDNSHFAERRGFFNNVILGLVAMLLFLFIPQLITYLVLPALGSDVHDLSWMFANIIAFILTIVVTIFGAKWLSKRNAVQLGFTKNHWLQQYGIGVLIGALMITLVFVGNVAFGAINVTNNYSTTSILHILLWVILFIFQGMNEEILFRGYLLPEIAAYMGKIPAVIITSIVFALLHGANPGMSIIAIVNLFIFSVFTSIVFYRTGNLWVVGAIHSMWNFFQGVIYGTFVSGQATESVLASHPVSHLTVINGGDFGFEGGILTTISYLIGIAVFVFYKGKKTSQS